jgi:hypothetical protein
VPELLNTEEAAELLKVKPATLKYWRHKRKGPPYIVLPGSQMVLYTRESIERWYAPGEVDHSRRRRNSRRTVPLHRADGSDSGAVA